MDSKYGEAYRRLYEEHWWWRARERIVLKELHALNPTDSWGSILDVGCGDALFFPKLSNLGAVEGIEPDGSLISRESAERWTVHVRPFDPSFQGRGPFDLILFLDVLEHISEPEEALAHALDLLTPKGVVLVTVPAFPVLWTSLDEVNHHFLRYTKSSFGRLAQKVGMRILSQRYLFHWLFAPKLVQRGLEFFSGKEKPPGIPRLPPKGLNSAMVLLSRVEEAVLRPVRFPFGSSLLVVGARE